MSFREVRLGFSRNRHGSVHILEVLVVGLMAMGAVLAVSTLNTTVERVEQDPARIGGDKAENVLDTLRALPATNTSVVHTHRLEELILQHLGGDTRALPELLRGYHSADHRLVLQVGGRERVITGPEEVPPSDVPDGASAFWYSRSGHTFIRPTLSHLDDQMDAWFELLPVWMDGVTDPAGRPFEVDVDFTTSTGALNRSLTLSHRLPVSTQPPLAVEPQTAGGSVAYVFTESQVDNGTGYEWDLHFHIAPTGDTGNVWLGPGDQFEVTAPQGWALSTLDDDWKRETEPDEPVWQMEYTGKPMKDDAEAWFNMTLERSSSHELDRHEVLRLASASPAGFETSLVLVADEPQVAPVIVVASQPSPYPLDEPLPLTFTLSNPTDDALSVDRFQVRFPDAHQFPDSPTDWIRGIENGEVTYTYDGSTITVAANTAETVSLPVRVENGADGDHTKRDRPPVLEYLGPGAATPSVRDGLLPWEGEPPSRHVSLPHQSGGLHGAWIATDDLDAGTHTVRVGHESAHRVPPGTGTFQRVEGDTGPFLPGLQQVRHQMRLSLEDPAIAPGDELTVRLHTAGLKSFLEDHEDELEPSADIRFEVGSGDLLGHLTGDAENDTAATWTLEELDDQDVLELTASFTRSAMSGPVVVDARLVITTQEHGEVRLNFLDHAYRSPNGETFTPVFMNAHLLFWLSQAQNGWQQDP